LRFLWTKFFYHRVATVATLPIRTLQGAIFVRSVQVGCSRFSRGCQLIIDLASIYPIERARRLTPSPELGFRLLLFPVEECFWFYAAAGIALWLLLCKGS
jgi:hypothetical protein